MGALTGGELCVKYLLFIFNFVFWVSAVMCYFIRFVSRYMRYDTIQGRNIKKWDDSIRFNVNSIQ